MSFQLELDQLISYISLSFVLFLKCSRKCNDILHAHKMYECSGMLQEQKVNYKKHRAFDDGISLVF
jgi:hypothetical protein